MLLNSRNESSKFKHTINGQEKLYDVKEFIKYDSYIINQYYSNVIKKRRADRVENLAKLRAERRKLQEEIHGNYHNI